MIEPFPRSRRCALLITLLLPVACSDSIPTATAPAEKPQAVQIASATIPGEYIVVLKPGATTGAVMTASLVAAPSGKVRHTYERAIQGFAAALSDDEVARLRANPNVEAVYANQPVYLTDTQVRPEWGLDRLDQRDLPFDRRYSYDGTGAGVTVYVVDSGIRATHSEFEGRAVAVDVTNDPFGTVDCIGHGTHVAGTVGGKTYGVAKKVNLVGVKMVSCTEGSSFATFLAALEWVIVNVQRPAVVNMSLIAPAFEPIDQAVRTLHGMGVLSVIASGNFGAWGCDWTPHAVSEALLVGATDRNDNRAFYSNTGECVDVHAPGSDVLSAGHLSDFYTYLSTGTSMAAPHAAGVAALYLETRPGAAPTRVHDAIIAAASPNRLNMGDAEDTQNRLLVNTFRPQGEGAFIAVGPQRLAFTMVDLPLGLIQQAALLEATETKTVRLTNFGDAPMEWRATSSEPWISFNTANGLLAPGSNTTISVSVTRTGLAAGTYDGAFTISAAGTANGPQTVPVKLTVYEPAPLPLGQTTAPFSGEEWSDRYWAVHVPPGVKRITFTMGAGTGDADMSIRAGAVPTENRNDCSPFQDSTDEVCEVLNPKAGIYFVRINAYSDYTGHTLTATIDGIPASLLDVNAEPVSASRIRVTWGDGSSNERQFVVQRRAHDGVSWDSWTEIGRRRANIGELIDRDRVIGVKYQYRVRPCNTLGCAAYVLAGTTIPPRPPVPAPLTAVATSGTSTRVAWNNVRGETEYRVMRRIRVADVWSAWTEVVVDPDIRRYDDAGLGGGLYQYRVRACNVSGCSGATDIAGIRLR